MTDPEYWTAAFERELEVLGFRTIRRRLEDPLGLLHTRLVVFNLERVSDGQEAGCSFLASIMTIWPPDLEARRVARQLEESDPAARSAADPRAWS